MFYLFPLLLSWPIGALADRIGPRRLLLIGAVAGTGSMLLPYFVREIAAAACAASETYRRLRRRGASLR